MTEKTPLFSGVFFKSKNFQKLSKHNQIYLIIFFISLYLLLNIKYGEIYNDELLDPSEIMFTPFEPKTQNRFIMFIEGIPSFTIKQMNRPSIQFDEVVLEHINVKRYVKGKGMNNH